jgi:hypothetical protein
LIFKTYSLRHFLHFRLLEQERFEVLGLVVVVVEQHEL